ncbi:hypothetical protein B0H13DRAFT_1483526, partial [Mycena leptocephala]
WQIVKTERELFEERAKAESQGKPESAKDPVKRKQPNQAISRPRKKRKVVVPALVGLKWDCVNYSCAYDALFTGLYHIWHGHGPLWTNRFASI